MAYGQGCESSSYSNLRKESSAGLREGTGKHNGASPSEIISDLKKEGGIFLKGRPREAGTSVSSRDNLVLPKKTIGPMAVKS